MDKDPEKKNRLGLWVGVTAVAVIGVVALAAQTPSSTATPAAAVQATQQQVSSPSLQPTPARPVAPTPTTLSNNSYYTNVDGNSVHAPADSSNGCVAAGATAECNDGSCSFSQHHSGTCSHHGGVAQWLN